MSDQAIEISGLRKTYYTLRGPVQALNGLDLEVRRGEVMGYVGVNGAGKSTSIKILLGLAQATQGRARVMGFAAGSLEARARIGYLPEVANYHEFMSAEELLAVHARLAKVPRDQVTRRCQEVLSIVGLGERRKSRIHEFSKGMKQRFGIAQALVADPPLLILDELTSGLDPFAQKELRDILLQLKERNITIFFSSHHMEEVESMCDRAAIIHKGVLRACGTIAQLTEQQGQLEALIDVPEQTLAQLSGDVPLSPAPNGGYSVQLSQDRLGQWLPQALEKGCVLRSVMPVRRSLEQVFHGITRTAVSV